MFASSFRELVLQK